jgi:hypothetical protein
MRLLVAVPGFAVLMLISSVGPANAQGAAGPTQIDWSLLQARQQAYDAVRGLSGSAAASSAYRELESAALSQGLTIPQFDSSPASNAARDDLDQELGLPSGRVTPDGDQIPIEAVCNEGLCFTGAPAGRVRENAAAMHVLLDTWVAEAMLDAVYVQANPP